MKDIKWIKYMYCVHRVCQTSIKCIKCVHTFFTLYGFDRCFCYFSKRSMSELILILLNLKELTLNIIYLHILFSIKICND